MNCRAQIAIRARVGHKKDAQPTMLDLLVRLYAHDVRSPLPAFCLIFLLFRTILSLLQDVMGEIVARDAAHPSELGRYMNPVRGHRRC